MTLPAYALNASNFPDLYERWLVGPLFRPFAEVLLERAQVAPGDRVLDIACGTGIVARLAQQRVGARGRVVAVDLSPQMLAVAKTIAPHVEWREGNATALPVGESEKFDLALCQQGLQFFPDRPAAAREMRRVLAPGGRVAIATWRPLEEVPFFRDLGQIAERHVGAVVDQRHAFGVAKDLETLVAGAGFRDVQVETIARTIRFDDPAMLLHLNAMAVVGMSAASKGMADDERVQLAAVIAQESAGVLPRYRDGQGIAFELRTNLATARA